MLIIFTLDNDQLQWNHWLDFFCTVIITVHALSVFSFWLLPSHFLDEALQDVCPCTDINQCAKRKSDGKMCINICKTIIINILLLKSGKNKWKISFPSCPSTYLYAPFFFLKTILTLSIHQMQINFFFQCAVYNKLIIWISVSFYNL